MVTSHFCIQLMNGAQESERWGPTGYCICLDKGTVKLLGRGGKNAVQMDGRGHQSRDIPAAWRRRRQFVAHSGMRWCRGSGPGHALAGGLAVQGSRRADLAQSCLEETSFRAY